MPHASANKKASNIIAYAGGFKLEFEDCTTCADQGFHDVAKGNTRIETVKAVAEYIASKIEIPSTAQPHVYFKTIEEASKVLGGNVVYAPAVFPGTIYTGVLHEHITNPTSGDPNGADPDAEIHINFWGSRFNDDYQNTPSSSEYDLFDVVLHEMSHALGFRSAIRDANGTSLSGAFTHFDKQLGMGYSGGTFSYMINDIGGGSYGCCGINTNNFTKNIITYYELNNTKIYSVYSPKTFANGSSMSHFDEKRDQEDYLMSYASEQGEYLREWHPAEQEVFCNIGYTLKGGCQVFPVAVSDNFTGQQGQKSCYEILANDYDPDGHPLVVDPDYLKVYNGEPDLIKLADSDGDGQLELCITADGDFCGIIHVRYRLLDPLTRNPGGAASVYINVDCDFCPDDPCNYICNGGFEKGIPFGEFEEYRANRSFQDFKYFPNPSQPTQHEPTHVDFWWGDIAQTPDLFIRGSLKENAGIPNYHGIPENERTITYNNSVDVDTRTGANAVPANDRYVGGYISENALGTEGIFTELVRELEYDANENYQLRFWVYGMPSDALTHLSYDVYLASFNQIQNILIQGQSLSNNSTQVGTYQAAIGSWEEVVANISGTSLPNTTNPDDMIKYVILNPQPLGAGASKTTAFYDDFSLRRKGHQLVVKKTVSNRNPAPGEEITYTITVSNISDDQTLTWPNGQSVTVTDNVPSSLIHKSGPFGSGISLFQFSNTFNPGESHSISFTMEVPSNTPCGTVITNCASITTSFGASACEGMGDESCVTIEVTSPLPKIEVDLQIDCDEVCMTVLNTPDFIMDWGDGLPVSMNSPDPTQAYCRNLSPGVHHLKVSHPGNSCDKDWFTTVVIPDPISVSPTSFTVCEFETLDLGAVGLQATGGLEPYNYFWPPTVTGMDIYQTNTREPGHFPGGARGTYTYVLTVVDATGCEKVIPITVEVLPVPNPDVQLPDDVCDKDDDYCFQIRNYHPEVTYIVDWGDGSGTSQYDPNIASNWCHDYAPGTYTFTLTASGTCGNATISKEFTVFDLPIPSISASGGCLNKTLTATATGGSGSYSYSWGSTSGNVLNIKVYETTTYTVTVTDQVTGCENYASITITGCCGPWVPPYVECDDNGYVLVWADAYAPWVYNGVHGYEIVEARFAPGGGVQPINDGPHTKVDGYTGKQVYDLEDLIPCTISWGDCVTVIFRIRVCHNGQMQWLDGTLRICHQTTGTFMWTVTLHDGSGNLVHFGFDSGLLAGGCCGFLGQMDPFIDDPVLGDGNTIWPNPAQTYVHLKKVSDVNIYSAEGRLVISEKETDEVWVGHLQPGLYILETKDGLREELIIER